MTTGKSINSLPSVKKQSPGQAVQNCSVLSHLTSVCKSHLSMGVKRTRVGTKLKAGGGR